MILLIPLAIISYISHCFNVLYAWKRHSAGHSLINFLALVISPKKILSEVNMQHLF